ncbi:MAG: hypothetical protein KKE30_01730 [Gammaproteobacteria bacterium]|nr:hypothetical protein [Gammaproteobacteria bacterium]
MPNFQDALQGKMPDDMPDGVPEQLTDEQIVKEINADNEKDYLTKLKKKNKNYLIKLDVLQRERIAQRIYDWYTDSKPEHDELCDEYDEFDRVYRMERKSLPGDDGTMPNYCSALSTVSLEVLHANIMNVFSAPKDIMTVLPTEQSDVPKVRKLSIFGNWSCEHELNLKEQIDRLFHSSEKNGECPYMVYWCKEYGIEIRREVLMNPANPREPLYDPDTKEPLYQEIEQPKLLYNAPKLDVFSRKDYIQPRNAVMGVKPLWEMRRVRISYDDYLRDYLQGKYYDGSIMDITDWCGEDMTTNFIDHDGSQIPVGKFQQEFIEFYGRLRVNAIKTGKTEQEEEETEELEDEFIALLHINSQTLCALRKNKFPLKMRPIGIDYFMPDDEGRRKAIGMIKFLDGPQKAYDALFNQYIFGVTQSNNPFGFFSPMSNMRKTPIKVKAGYLFPTSDPKSVNMVKLSPPDSSMQEALELINNWAQLMFGVSDYSAGVESKIDPSAPARKAQIVLGQGSVRMNLIVNRKHKTLKDILLRWFLLYRDNMPNNKFMRIAGSNENNPFEFHPVKIEDFQLRELPDFALTGNVLSTNKELMARSRLAIYNVLAQNPLYAAQTKWGMQNLSQLTKWLTDGIEELGLPKLKPPPGIGENVYTPEEENARFLQGDIPEPTIDDDFVDHVMKHQAFAMQPTTPEKLRAFVMQHIERHVKLLQTMLAAQLAAKNAQSQGVLNAVTGGAGQIPQRANSPVDNQQPATMEGYPGRAEGLPQ